MYWDGTWAMYWMIQQDVEVWGLASHLYIVTAELPCQWVIYHRLGWCIGDNNIGLLSIWTRNESFPLRRGELNFRDTLAHTTLGCYNRVKSQLKRAYFITPSTVGQCQFCGNDFIAPSTKVWTTVNNSSIRADPMQSSFSCWKNSADQSVGLPSCCINHGRWNHHFILNCLKKDFHWINRMHFRHKVIVERERANQPLQTTGRTAFSIVNCVTSDRCWSCRNAFKRELLVFSELLLPSVTRITWDDKSSVRLTDAWSLPVGKIHLHTLKKLRV